MIERKYSRMAADDVAVSAYQHEAMDTNRPEGVEDRTASPAHYYGAWATDRG
ncbi:hypothetical protein ACFU7T_35035 [Streptomyces sp. NPDC057555]|uniref:hypothetical protein n=1 Tax=Streptomyces sp. NPDC057555 TaxID=3346166 RepID=UPI00367BEA62